MKKNPCYGDNNKVLVFLTKLLTGNGIKKVLFGGVSNKLELLIKEVNNLSEGKQEDCDKSFCDMFKNNFKYNSLPILKNDIIMKKLIDFSDTKYLALFIRDFCIIFFYKFIITELFKKGIGMYDTIVNPNILIYIVGLILALFCGAMTNMLYHAYRETPNNIAFNDKGVLIAMLISAIFWFLFTFIGFKMLMIILSIMMVEYLIVLTVFTTVTTIYHKMVYLFR